MGVYAVLRVQWAGLPHKPAIRGSVRPSKSPMHIHYPGNEDKRRYKYYVCSQRLSYATRTKDYIRADILERSILEELRNLRLSGKWESNPRHDAQEAAWEAEKDPLPPRCFQLPLTKKALKVNIPQAATVTRINKPFH